MAEGLDRAVNGRAVLLFRVTGAPGRLDATALDTFRAMMTDTPNLEGFSGMQYLLADPASSTIVVLAMFESRENIAKLDDRIRAALDISRTIIGADPAASVVDVLDVIDVPGAAADISIS